MLGLKADFLSNRIGQVCQDVLVTDEDGLDLLEVSSNLSHLLVVLSHVPDKRSLILDEESYRLFEVAISHGPCHCRYSFYSCTGKDWRARHCGKSLDL